MPVVSFVSGWQRCERGLSVGAVMRHPGAAVRVPSIRLPMAPPGPLNDVEEHPMLQHVSSYASARPAATLRLQADGETS